MPWSEECSWAPGPWRGWAPLHWAGPAAGTPRRTPRTRSLHSLNRDGVRIKISAGDPDADPQNSYPDLLIRGTDPDPDPSLFWNKACKIGIKHQILAKNLIIKTEDNVPVGKLFHAVKVKKYGINWYWSSLQSSLFLIGSLDELLISTGPLCQL